MKNITDQKIEVIGQALKNGQIGILPTDTIYGIHGSALIPEVVEKIYNLKKREERKPLIILISDLKDLEIFKVKVSKKVKQFLKKIWPNPVSIILLSNNPKFDYLHLDYKTLAFRIPKHELLLKILKISGPLISTSANFHKEPAAVTVEQAKKSFGQKVDFYLDSGRISAPASTIACFDKNKIKIIRQGKIKLPDQI